MATGVGSLQYPYHITRTYCSLACTPHTHPLVFVTAVSHMRAGPVVSATSWSSKLSTPRSHRHLRVVPLHGPVVTLKMPRQRVEVHLLSPNALLYEPTMKSGFTAAIWA